MKIIKSTRGGQNLCNEEYTYTKKVSIKFNILCEYYYIVNITYLKFNNKKLAFNMVDIVHLYFNKILKS